MLEIVVAVLLAAVEPAAPQEAPPEGAAAESARPGAPADAPAAGAPAEGSEPAAAEPSASPANAAAAAPAAAAGPAAGAPPAPTPSPLAPRRVTASLGLARSIPGGWVAEDFPINDLTSSMMGIHLDFGVRITPRWMAALTLDVAGGGTPGVTYRLLCATQGDDCQVSSGRVSLEGRYTFRPEERRTLWVGAGLGGETTRVTVEGSDDARDDLPSWSGGLLRLSAGWDHRMSRTWGYGLYAAMSMGQYDEVTVGDSGDPVDVGDPRGHSWLDLGVRFILFP